MKASIVACLLLLIALVSAKPKPNVDVVEINNNGGGSNIDVVDINNNGGGSNIDVVQINNGQSGGGWGGNRGYNNWGR